MTKHINRRIFLRGLGGAVVAAPFLSSLADRAAKAQSATASGPPKRLIMMFTHYGCVTNRFFPTKTHGALTAADLTGTSLEPLAPYVDKLLLPRGMRAMNEWTSGMTRGQGNDPHTQVAGSFFTCHPVTPNSDNPFSFDAATKANTKPTGRSLDHLKGGSAEVTQFGKYDKTEDFVGGDKPAKINSPGGFDALKAG